MEKQEDCGILLKQLHDSMERQANNSLRESGLTLSQMRCIQYLEQFGPQVPMKEIEHYFQVSQPTVVGIIKRLEAKGLIRTSQSPKDARAKNVNLTPKGQKFARESVLHRTRAEQKLLEPLTHEEAEELKTLLRRMLDHINNA